MDFSIDVRESNGLRTLHFDKRWMQGAMRVTRPWDLELEYTQVMMACLLMRDENRFPRNILMIGLGAGSMIKFLYRHCPLAHLTVVEIDARLVDVAREHFGLPDDPLRLNVVVGDGVNYMMTSDQTFDLILVDGFDKHADPGDLNKLPFYQACRSRLSDEGLLVTNIVGLSYGVKGGFTHIESAFEDRALMFPKCKSGNTITFASAAGVINSSLDELKERAVMFEQKTGIALLPILTRLEFMEPGAA